jgi:CheY-like chemotaxis protein
MEKKLKSIVLIDDDEPTNYLHKLILKKIDCVEHIEVFQTGKDAINYLSKLKDHNSEVIRPDIIFLDINMPKMNGWEFIEQFRKIKREENITVIMLTTSLNPDDELLSEKIPEIKTFINKPLTRAMMEEIIKEYFSKVNS